MKLRDLGMKIDDLVASGYGDFDVTVEVPGHNFDILRMDEDTVDVDEETVTIELDL